MDAQELTGLAVVTLAGAERLGRVDDVLFETAPLRAKALMVKSNSGQQVIALTDVRNIGPDAVITNDAESAATGGAAFGRTKLPGLDDLGELKVVDELGAFVGHITRVELDPVSGDVSRLDIRRGELLGVGGQTTTLALDQVISVGSELVTVRDGAVPGDTVGR